MALSFIALVSALILTSPADIALSSGVRKEAQSMIDALVNSNSPPELVEFPSAVVPRFSRDYDWGTQTRALSAFHWLRKNKSEDIWEELLEHLDDGRYALTMMTDGDISTTENYSVGRICAIIARGRLLGVTDGLIEPREDGLPAVPANPALWKDLAGWRKKRGEKRLYQLQIDVCQDAITRLSSMRGMTKEAIEVSRIQLTSEVQSLQETKRAVFRDHFYSGTFSTFDSRRVKQLWDKWTRKKAEGE